LAKREGITRVGVFVQAESSIGEQTKKKKRPAEGVALYQAQATRFSARISKNLSDVI